MKRYIIIAILCISILIAGCASQTPHDLNSGSFSTAEPPITNHVVAENSIYTITTDNGRYYFTFKELNDRTDSLIEGSYHPSFSTLGEMKNAILNNTFTEDQFAALQVMLDSSENTIEICNVNELYEPMVPSDLSVTGVTWYGKTYGFGIRSKVDPDMFAGIYINTVEEFEDSLQSDYHNWMANDHLTLLSQTLEQDRNAAVYTVSTNAATLKYVLYTITDGSKTLYIKERYCLEHSIEGLINETVPYAIQIWGIHNGVYFSGSINYPTERPSVEWLSSFGLREYVETATE